MAAGQKASNFSGLSRCFLLFCLIVGLAGCATSGPKIQTMSDSESDFSAYKTYGFVEELGTDKSKYSSLLTKYLKNSVSRELEARGYQKAEDPDLLVNFYVKTEDKTKVSETPSASVGVGYGRGYYGYRVGYYSTWPFYPSDTHVSEYTQGTLNIDLVDSEQKQLVWEGVAVGKVTDEFREQLETNIQSVVKQIFAKYPYQAGSGDAIPASP